MMVIGRIDIKIDSLIDSGYMYIDADKKGFIR